jgi:hypothetical protein
MIAKFNATALAAVIGLALSLGAVGAKATNLITNGSFESLSGGIGQIGYNGTSLTGWTNGAYEPGRRQLHRRRRRLSASRYFADGERFDDRRAIHRQFLVCRRATV